VNDVERWIDLEGEEPPVIRELLDAARGVPGMTPERADRVDRSIRAAIAAQRRAWERKKRRGRWAVRGVLLAAALAGMATFAFRGAPGPPIAGAPSVAALNEIPAPATTPLRAGPAPPAPDPSAPDAAPASRPQQSAETP